MSYKHEIQKSMKYLGKKKNTIFLGQSVAVPGNLLFGSLSKVHNNKKLELPLFEETQMGMSIGLSLNGFIPITCYPRFDFLVCATNQLVNHLDKISIISEGQFQPRVIIRTSIGSQRPLDPQKQHTGDFTDQFRKICTNIDILKLNEPEDILNTYKKAIDKKNKKSTKINTKRAC